MHALFDKPRRLKGGTSVQDFEAKSSFSRGTHGNAEREYDEEEKREVYTGPNPLHNR